MKKKVLAVALAAAMTVGTVPAAVFAEEAEKPYEGVTLSMWIGTSVSRWNQGNSGEGNRRAGYGI